MASTNITQIIADAANAAGIDPTLAINVAVAESSLNPAAVSPAGAQGLFQLMPATARQLGVTNPFDPVQSAAAGTQYLAQLLAMFNGDETKALAAYNWGPGNVTNAIAQYGDAWLSYAPTETQNYVSKILGGQQFTPSFAPAAAVAAAGSNFVNNAAQSATNFLTGLSPAQLALLGGAALVAWYFITELLD